MFKLVFLLCMMILATMVTLGGRQDGPLRDGLAGAYAPLVPASSDPSPEPSMSVAAVQAVPARKPAQRTAAPAIVPPQQTAPAQAAPAISPVISAAFVTPPAEGDPGTDASQNLTLALPLVAEGAQNAPASAAPDALPDGQAPALVRYVAGENVNVRAGPSAETESLARLGQGEAVLVLPSDTPGWSMIRIEGDGLEGYIATRFLGNPPQDGIFTPVD